MRAAQPTSVWFGTELKVAYWAQQVRPDDSSVRKTFLRLCQEPIIVSVWPQLMSMPATGCDYLEIASLLCGQRLRSRGDNMRSLQGLGSQDLYYEPLAVSSTWLVDIRECDGSAHPPLFKALYRFARIICAHPFSDGNGRFARAALQASLGANGLIAAPCLGLAPTFYMQRARVHEALGNLSRTGNWLPYIETMTSVLELAVRNVSAATAMQPVKDNH